MGGHLCWKLAADKTVAPKLSGLFLLGSLWDEDFFKSSAFKRKVPVFFGQGSPRHGFPRRAAGSLLSLDPREVAGYPTRFVRFETGTLGTPIRMGRLARRHQMALAAN